MPHYNGTFLRRPELEALGVTCGGDEVFVHASSVLLHPERLRLGNHVRIDPFCIISAGGGIDIGSYIHIGAYTNLAGAAGIVIEDYSGISPGVRVFTVTEDLSGRFMTNPMIPAPFRKIKSGPVRMEKFTGLYTGVVVLPGVTIGEGSMVGAGSLVRKNVTEWEIWFGNPAKRISRRRKDLLRLVDDMVAATRIGRGEAPQ
jgi:acetyltransferase-like isoleucine patch superfamily enzyme